MSFDAKTGNLWVGEVGGIKREEVNLVRPGGNYGWGIFEGELCNHYTDEHCEEHLDSVVMPVFSYAHGTKYGCAIIGGTVYRGTAIPWLHGMYIFGDHCNDNIRVLEGDYKSISALPYCARADDEAGLCNKAEENWTVRVINTGVRQLYSFATDDDGELYLLSAADNPVLKLVELPEKPAP